MLKDYGDKATKGIVGSVIIAAVGQASVFSKTPYVPLIGYIVILIGFIIFFWGLSAYAQSKGHSRWWGLLSFLLYIGLIILYFFPDKHKNALVSNINQPGDNKPMIVAESQGIVSAGGSPQPKPRSSAATASLILGIIGIPLCCLIIPPVLAVIIGIVALVKIKNSNGLLLGRAKAIVGIILGTFSTILVMLSVLFLGKIEGLLSGDRYERGIQYQNEGKYNEAIDCYNEAIARNPQFAEAYANLGVAKYEIGDYEGAKVDLLKAVELSPDLKSIVEPILEEVNKKLAEQEKQGDQK